jgi:hypothetical protein
MTLWAKRKVEIEVIDPEPLPKQELRRRAILLDEPQNDVEKLAEQASTLLGYSLLSQYIGRGGPLCQVLRKLQMPILNSEEVSRYSEYMLNTVRKKLNPNQQASWARADLQYYKEPIPEFVLRKAVQIKKLCPEVHFEIQYLEIGFKSADPFLRAYCYKPEESYYIEVWDEPEFEVKL